jgi:hypothetical protein
MDKDPIRLAFHLDMNSGKFGVRILEIVSHFLSQNYNAKFTIQQS